MRTDQAKKLVEDAARDIKEMMREQKWRDAHRACLEILRFNPDSIKIIRLKSRIEKIVAKINRAAVIHDVNSLKPLWNEKRYRELLEYLKKLEPYARDYPRIRSLVLKATKAYKNQLLATQNDFIGGEVKRISEIAAGGGYAEARKATETLLKQHFTDIRIRRLLEKIRHDWIESQLKQNAGLTGSEKYEDIILFYQGLLQIDGKSVKVRKLMEAAKKKYALYRIQQKREIIYKQTEKIKTLYQMGRHALVAEIAEEILEIDPKNREAKYYLVKAVRKTEQEIDSEIFQQMRNSRRQLKADRKNTARF